LGVGTLLVADAAPVFVEHAGLNGDVEFPTVDEYIIPEPHANDSTGSDAVDCIVERIAIFSPIAHEIYELKFWRL
jgi:hypothetical protein